MVKETVWLMDNKNEFPSLDNVTKYTSIIEIYIIYIVFICYWSYIYYKKYFKYTRSIIVGCISSFLLIYLRYKLSNYEFGLQNTQNKWVYNSDKLSDATTDLTSIKINKSNYPDIDIDFKKHGYLITKEYFDKLQKQQKISSPDQQRHRINYNSKTETQINKPKYVKMTLHKMNYKTEMLMFQGFCLITILFTIFSLIWNINKKLFKKLITLFIQAISISIPFILLSYWFSDIKEWLFIFDIKTNLLFLGVSITLAILSEIMILYSFLV